MNKHLTPLTSIAGLLLCLPLSSAVAQSAPYAYTHRPILVTTTNATLCGMAVANGVAASAWFEWGRDNRFDQATAAENVGSGMGVQVVRVAVSSLIPGALYRCRLVVSNELGVAVGPNISFATGRQVYVWGAGAESQPMPSGLAEVVGVAAGDSHYLALNPDGSVVAWGSNTSGQTNVPPGLANVIRIAAGGNDSMALLSDGTVKAWGAGYTYTNVPGGLGDVVEITAGRWHGLALKADGTVITWSEQSHNAATNMPSGLSNVVAVAAGEAHSLALTADGRVVAWGSNIGGQTNVPPDLGDVMAVAAGGSNSMVLRRDGRVLEWGSNKYGQTNVPVNLTDAVGIGCGGLHGLAIRADGSVVAWGYSSALQTAVPPGLGAAIEAAGGANRSLVLADKLPLPWTHPATAVRPTSARLSGMFVPYSTPVLSWFEWGPQGGYSQTTSPRTIDSGTVVTNLNVLLEGLVEGANYQFRLVVSNRDGILNGMPRWFTTGGSLKVAQWGLDQSGQRIVPPTLTNAVAVDAGLNHGVALKSDGTVAAWGSDAYGEVDVPANLSNVVALSTYATYNLALKEDGTLSAWGVPNANYGQTIIPANATNLVAVAAGWLHVLALTADGKVLAWGNSMYHAINVPAALSNVVEIAVGDTFSLALKADGSLAAWSLYNQYGEITVTNINNAVAVAAGGHHNVALKADGTVVAWGWNASGQTNVPAGLSNVVAVAAGSRHCLALKSDGTVVGWGAGPNNNDSNPERGQATIPSGMAGVVAIAGGDFNSITLGLNVPPQASSLSVTGALSSDLPITLPVWDPNGDALSCRIMTFPTTGSIFQYTDSGRGDLLSPANCLVMDPEGRVLFAPTPQPYVWPYATFTCQASDGEADSALGTVTVNLVPEPSLNPGTVTFGPTGSFTMSFLGVTNAGYRVWGSTNLSNWAFLGSATQSDIGVFIYGDTGATNAPCRFYRVTCP